jgi:NAD(P)H dehydrogenase (quinone)
MYAITGITGKVGGAVARALLDAGESVRAVVRDADKGAAWWNRGCEVALADITDAAALARAFENTDGVFLMMPPLYDPEPGFPSVYATLAATRTAIEAARPGKVVFLSTVGAQVAEPNLLNALTIMEKGLREVSVPIAFLRAAWFMENAAWDVDPARSGRIASYLQPLDHAIPMVATEDIGRAAAELLRESWHGARIVELEGPRCYSANDIGAAFSRVLGHAVVMDAVPRATWEAAFRAQGTKNPEPRMRMLDGFNEGWIDFEHRGEVRRGSMPLDDVIARLAGRA